MLAAHLHARVYRKKCGLIVQWVWFVYMSLPYADYLSGLEWMFIAASDEGI